MCLGDAIFGLSGDATLDLKDRRFHPSTGPFAAESGPYVESFNSRARDELFAREIFDSVLEAKVLYADWCHAYNVHRPHSALSYQPPAVFAKAISQS